MGLAHRLCGRRPGGEEVTITDDLIRDEGLKLKPYRDTVGKLTIGVGRNLDDVGISREEALLLLESDLHSVEADLDLNCPWWREMTEGRQRGLLNMGFMGWPRLSGFVRMLNALADEDYDTAASEALMSKWATQVGQRAVRIAKLFREG
jgi:lysozyme